MRHPQLLSVTEVRNSFLTSRKFMVLHCWHQPGVAGSADCYCTTCQPIPVNVVQLYSQCVYRHHCTSRYRPAIQLVCIQTSLYQQISSSCAQSTLNVTRQWDLLTKPWKSIQEQVVLCGQFPIYLGQVHVPGLHFEQNPGFINIKVCYQWNID